MARHAQCRVCYRRQPVTVDGVLFKHPRGGEPCEGSGKPVAR